MSIEAKKYLDNQYIPDGIISNPDLVIQLMENFHSYKKGQELNENNVKGLRDEIALSVTPAYIEMENANSPDVMIEAVNRSYEFADMMIERRKH